MSTGAIGVSPCSSGRISSAFRKGQSIGSMTTRPIRFSTATLWGPAFTVTCPTPGVPAGKFAGRSRRFSLVMYSTISRLSQMWLPEVRTSAPASNACRAIGGGTPDAAAGVSRFTPAKNIARALAGGGRRWAQARKELGDRLPARLAVDVADHQDVHERLLRHFDGACLADDDHFDVAGILHLGLDALADVLRELVGVEVGDDVGLRHHAQLAPGLDRVAHLDALVP